jgi:serine/threonine protein kinase
MLSPEQWQKVERVLQSALDLPASERDTFLSEQCREDQELFFEASSLLNAHEEAGDFIEEPAIVRDAEVLLGDVYQQHGRMIGPYRIIRPLGVGGMSEVFLAEDSRLDRPIALKILPEYFAADEGRLRRFQGEARAASALNHPNILTIYDIGEAGGVYFIATEYIDGQTIRQLSAEKKLSLDVVLDVAEQVCSALVAAHDAGIVHRDIKPENIMRRADGLVKILDFGIAKLLEPESADAGSGVETEAGMLLGTVNYMSPEQARGLAIDERTDLWSLGVVLYEMIARRLPFKGATRMDTIVAILEREPAPLFEGGPRNEAPRSLQTLIGKCLEKDVQERVGSTTELLSELKRIAEQLKAQPVSTTVTADEIARQPKSHTNRWLVVSLVAILITAGIVAILYRGRVARVNNPVAASQKLYSQMSDAEKLEFIRAQEHHISALMGDRPAQLNDEALQAIKFYVDRYAARTVPPVGTESLNDTYSRAPQYASLIARSFSARRVPVIIGLYLPMIESAYKPCFENSFGSKGLFQFLPQTAKLYGVSPAEMCDAEKMAPAAAHYIADHMAELGDDAESMTLVLLSYNHGAGWVRTTLRELRETNGYQRNFWTLFAHRNELGESFRREGAGYVPSFFAAAIVGENPQVFGLTVPPLSEAARQ